MTIEDERTAPSFPAEELATLREQNLTAEDRDRIEERIYDAIEGVIGAFHLARQREGRAIADPAARIGRYIELGVPDEIDESLTLVYESIPVIARRPQQRPLHGSIVERQVLLYLETIEEGVASGRFDPAVPARLVAEQLVALEDAYDLYPLIGVDRSRAALREGMRRTASVLLGAEIPG